jgi:acetylornithine deacetylase/succinyl-diaminopimelate desuccinylase-like protein
MACVLFASRASAAEPDWNAVGAEAARLLAEYVRLDTQNPPGRTVEAAEFLAGLLARAGIASERTGADPNKPILVARLRGRGKPAKPIVLLNHMDVVPADPGKWSFPPLSGEMRDGMIYGRGTIDMKGFGVVQLLALTLLAQQGSRPQRDIVFLAVPDEEVGGGMGVEWLSQHRGDLMDVEAVWDEGGYGLTDAFPKPVLLVAVTEKSVLWLRLVAEGPAGHGSRPFPEAAPQRLQRALQNIFDHQPPPRLTPVTNKTIARIGAVMPGLRGLAMRNVDNPLVWPFVRGALVRDPLSNASVRDTISLTMLQAGYKPNVIPERAEAVLDCRLLPGTTQEGFVEHLRRAVDDPAITIEVIQPIEPAPVSPTRHPLFKAIERASRTVYPAAVVTPFMSIGGTDSRYFRRRKVPAYGAIPMLITKELVATAHGIDERLPVATLGPAVRVVYEALKGL